VECSLAAKGVKTIRDRVAATHLYRIAQEATSNAARHGHAKKIEVSLAVDDEQGVLKISDDGEGFFADNKSTGLGLRTMKYRAAEINGALRFESTPNVGTTVICSFPVRGA
jgi:signal transduction histidine kinase